jgi:hypothetical protein
VRNSSRVPSGEIIIMRASIPAADAEKLQILFRELPPLVWLTRNAIKIDEASQALAGDELERFRRHAEKLAQLIATIRAIAEA